MIVFFVDPAMPFGHQGAIDVRTDLVDGPNQTAVPIQFLPFHNYGLIAHQFAGSPLGLVPPGLPFLRAVDVRQAHSIFVVGFTQHHDRVAIDDTDGLSFQRGRAGSGGHNQQQGRDNVFEFQNVLHRYCLLQTIRL